jgi:hypothetical protein
MPIGLGIYKGHALDAVVTTRKEQRDFGSSFSVPIYQFPFEIFVSLPDITAKQTFSFLQNWCAISI